MRDVIPGAEAWSAEGGDIGALVLHGFTGNPVSMRPLAEALAHDGFTVEMPLLPGHGTTWQDLARTTWHDWAREAAAGLERLRRRTRARIAVGQSMGATLALRLAQTRGEDLAGIVLINPSLFHRDPLQRLLPVLKWVLPSLPGVGNDIAKPGGDERPYARTPLKGAAQLFQLQRVVREHLDAVTVPTLLFSSRADHVVDPANGDLVVEQVRSAEVERVALERSYHVATLDHDARLIEERTSAFVRKVSGSAP